MKDPETIARLDAELARLNEAVDHALAMRKAWMDAHMPSYAKFQVGEEIFSLVTCDRLGVVTRLYRYHEDDATRDRNMHVDYEYETGRSGSCVFQDNTSRQAYGCIPGTRQEAADRLRQRAEITALGITDDPKSR